MTEAPLADEPLAAPPPLDLASTSLFLDLDGTIAPLEQAPEHVGPDLDRRRLLEALSAGLDGRLAVVSGRTLADLDRVLEGRVPALGAVHGLVRRAADGQVCEVAGAEALREAVDDIRAFAAADHGLLVEDKGAAVSLHYRQSPQAAAAARDVVRRLAGRLGLRALEGDMVIELRADGPDKGAATAAFMREAPFTGFRPVFVGDDLTDEDGFRAARRLGGYGVIAGGRRPTDARFALGGVDAVRAWLAAAVERAA
jgi:trehalose 6-phosphate phosphatase